MSRSYCPYDEDWQRRKSLLIRSLFHDIPILSPVEEESNGSSHDYIPTQEAFPSPERPYSPLPPLIIEQIPVTNKHDEPEEFYIKLHEKIKRIYKKLFIENWNVSSMDLDSNYNDSSINDDGEGSVDNLVINTENNSPDSNSDIEEREERPSSASTKSNGYGADFESMDTAIIDVVNRTASIEDVVMISEEEETGSENIDKDRTRYENDRNSRSTAVNDESKIQRRDNEKEDLRYSTTDNQDTTDTEESTEAEIEQRGEIEASDKEVMDEYEMIETIKSNTVKVDADVSRGVESHHSLTDDQEMTKSDESNEEEKQQVEADRHSDANGSKSEAFERISSGAENNLVVQNDEPMEEDVETSQSSGGPYFKQITTEALIHFDGYEDSGDRESRVYEDSVKSVILPTRFRRVIASRNEEEDRIEVLAELEESADPRTSSTFDTDENETTEEDLEEVTTPHLEGNVERDEPDPIKEDEEMNASQSDASDRNREETNVTGETEEWQDLESDDTYEENEEMVDEPNYVGEMRLRLDTIEEDDEDISTNNTVEDFEVGVEETTIPRVKKMSVRKPTAEGEAEVETDLRIDAPEEEFEQISPAQLDPIKEQGLETEFAHRNSTDEEIRTPTPDTNQEDLKSSQTEVTREESEPTLTPRQKAIKEQMIAKVFESTVKEIKTPEAATNDVEELESPHSIELMRTPRPDLSHGTIPVPVTRGSSSESTGEHTALPQELTTLTLSTQDGVDNNMSELQTSNDMNEILTSIFNESQTKDGNTISGRKRKLVDKSVQAVQANRVTWDEIRGNFFIGTPKIFRLCACTDHVCP